MGRLEGKIVYVASQLGLVGAPEIAHYSASKGGVIAFTKALAREVAAGRPGQRRGARADLDRYHAVRERGAGGRLQGRAPYTALRRG